MKDLWQRIVDGCLARNLMVGTARWDLFLGDRWIKFNHDWEPLVAEIIGKFEDGPHVCQANSDRGILFLVKDSKQRKLALFFRDDALQMFGQKYVEEIDAKLAK